MRRLLVVVGLVLPALTLGQTTRVLPSDSVQSGCVLNAANTTCVLPMTGKLSAGFVITAISSPTGIALVNESSRDGTNWDGKKFIDMDFGGGIDSIPNASLAVGFGKTLVTGGGVGWVRIRASTWTSGSVTVLVRGTDTFADLIWADLGAVAATIQPPSVSQVGGWVTTAAPSLSTTTLNSLSLDTAGSLRVVDKGDGATGAAVPAVAMLSGANATSSIPALTTGNLAALYSDLQGRLLVRADHANPFVCRTSGQTTMVNSTCTPSAPAGASVNQYVTGVVLSNGPTAQTLKVIASTTTACGGSPTDVTSTVYLGVNSGASMTFPTPVKTGQANSYLCCQGSGNTAASCTITGYLAP